MHVESLILLGGLPFDVCLVLSGSHIAVCFHPLSQIAEPSSTVIIFLILNGFSLLLLIPSWSLFYIFLAPVSQYLKASSTAIIFLFTLGLTISFCAILVYFSLILLGSLFSCLLSDLFHNTQYHYLWLSSFHFPWALQLFLCAVFVYSSLIL